MKYCLEKLGCSANLQLVGGNILSTNFSVLVTETSQDFNFSSFVMSGLHTIKSGTLLRPEKGSCDKCERESEPVWKTTGGFSCYSGLYSQCKALCFSSTSRLSLHHEQKCLKMQLSPLFWASHMQPSDERWLLYVVQPVFLGSHFFILSSFGTLGSLGLYLFWYPHSYLNGKYS